MGIYQSHTTVYTHSTHVCQFSSYFTLRRFIGMCTHTRRFIGVPTTHDGLGRAALVRRFKPLKPSHKGSPFSRVSCFLEISSHTGPDGIGIFVPAGTDQGERVFLPPMGDLNQRPFPTFSAILHCLDDPMLCTFCSQRRKPRCWSMDTPQFSLTVAQESSRLVSYTSLFGWIVA